MLSNLDTERRKPFGAGYSSVRHHQVITRHPYLIVVQDIRIAAIQSQCSSHRVHSHRRASSC